MPGAPDCVIYQKALCQRAAVMSASARYCENVIALTNQDYGLVFIVAEERHILGKLVEFNARFQIGS